jgi:hypothetical protein
MPGLIYFYVNPMLTPRFDVNCGGALAGQSLLIFQSLCLADPRFQHRVVSVGE